MPTKPRLIESADKPGTDSRMAPAPQQNESGQGSLKAIVRQALLIVLQDPGASAAAKASAGRTLMQFCDDDNDRGRRRGSEMTAAELDQAIADASQLHPAAAGDKSKS